MCLIRSNHINSVKYPSENNGHPADYYYRLYDRKQFRKGRGFPCESGRIRLWRIDGKKSNLLLDDDHIHDFSADSIYCYWFGFGCKSILQIEITDAHKSTKNGMDHIANQDLDFQILYTSEDELGKLCSTFEQMRNEVYQSNRKMWEMLQERKALTASVSHDLRTPITVIKGYLDYIEKSLSKGSLTKDTLKITVQNMTQATERLVRYVECVKDIQKSKISKWNMRR